MVVEPKVASIQEEHFADLGLKDDALIDEPDAKPLRCTRHQLAILEEDFCGRESVGFQDELALEILNLIEWTAVAVMTLFEVVKPWLVFRRLVLRHRQLLQHTLRNDAAFGPFRVHPWARFV
jgi:hypothetical protein